MKLMTTRDYPIRSVGFKEHEINQDYDARMLRFASEYMNLTTLISLDQFSNKKIAILYLLL